MPNLALILEQVATDARVGELAYQLKVSSADSTAVELFLLSPRVPDGVSLVEVKDASQEATQARRAKLLTELTVLLTEFLALSVKEFRDKQQEIERVSVKEVIAEIGSPLNFWRVYFTALRGTLLKSVRRARERRNALGLEIASVQDAERALVRFFPKENASEHAIARHVFETKLEQLKDLDAKTGNVPMSLAEVEPGSYFSATYVLRVKRSLLNPRHFRFALDVQYGLRGQPQRYNSEVSTTLVVGPSSALLLCLALLGSSMGTAMKFALANSSSDSAASFAGKLGVALVTGPGLSAAVLSIALFVAFEHTDLSKNGRLALNWRTALVLGVAAGMFSDRFVSAFKALLGLGA
jgi:hypothetical protein